ncbi:MAG: glycoside hydrolase family 127 protein [Massilibacteroides sp.]|nr:glycoside hydrolase family 127 protein [Massilibacteroides sp.]
MKQIILILCLSLSPYLLKAQLQPEIAYFRLEEVRLLDSPFKRAENLDKRYLLELKADKLLAPFLREAGLTPKEDSYTNWENTGLDGHIGGHYLSGLALMYASTGDPEIKARLEYMISELKRCQEANGNGYIGGVPNGKQIWDEIAAGKIKAASFSLNDRWVPLYNIHKTYAGLRDAYLYGGIEDAKGMLIGMTDWMIGLTSALSDEQIQDMLRSEHGGLNETFADVAAITGDKKYLVLAKRFSHRFILDPLLKREDKLTGLHANTQIPKVIGFKRIGDLTENAEWDKACHFFWETVVENRSVSIGGNSESEHFHPADDFSKMIKSIEGPETCNTYNMLRLTKMLYQTDCNKSYIDYYERALYNHILSTQHPTQGGFVYFTQMRPGHYRIYSQPQTSFWCCVGSGLENHAKYGEMIYAHTENELYVNLFIPSRINWKEKQTEIVQQNKFPDESSTELIVNPREKTEFTLKLRVPSWADHNCKIFINGESYLDTPPFGDYISINRTWQKGDKIRFELPMKIRVEQLPDKSNYYSFLYGPIVLAAKCGTEDMTDLFADDSRGGHIAHGKQIPLNNMPVIVSEPDKICSLVKPVDSLALTFKLSGLYPGKFSSEMELVPFFRLHSARYILYWPQATATELRERLEETAKQERMKLKLDGITIDHVTCGKQQPESDHFFKSENSGNGFSEDSHWRDAHGWFSYTLNNNDRKKVQLYFVYFEPEEVCDFDIYINEYKVQTIVKEKMSENNLIAAKADFPPDLQQAEKIVVKFIAHPASKTPQITEVRLLRK